RPLSGAPVSVKWPNDLFIGQAKFGGCLVEVSGAAEGPCRAVVGIGISLFCNNRAMSSVEQDWTTLEDHDNDTGRNRLAAGLPVRVLAGQKVTLRGTAAGIDSHGQLLVRCDDRIKTVAGGEVSVRVG